MEDIFDMIVDNNQSGVIEEIKKGNINTTDRELYTPLHLAVAVDNFELTKLLLENGANLKAQDKWGNTPLHRAMSSYRGGDGKIIKYLIEQGANIDIENYYGVSPRKVADIIANYDLKQFIPNWYFDTTFYP